MCYALKQLGILVDPFKSYDDKPQNIREKVYNQRYGFFIDVMFPRFKSYQSYIKNLENEMTGNRGGCGDAHCHEDHGHGHNHKKEPPTPLELLNNAK